MDDSDISKWCAEMLAGTDLATEQAEASSGSQEPTPVAKSPPVARIPLSDTLEAWIAPKGWLSGDCSPGAASSSGEGRETASAAPAMLQGPFVESPVVARRPWEGDSVYQEWVPDIEEPMKPVKELRGEFLEPLVCATLFGGLSSERQVLKLHSVPSTWAFSCDIKPASVAWAELNYSRPGVHYMDALDFLASDSGRDLFSGQELKDLKDFFGTIDILFVSTSCKPYSSARTGRKTKGSRMHDDTKLIKAFFKAAKLVRPGVIVFEQVYGFALSESVSDPQSPLLQFLADCDTELPDYARTIFVVDGDLFLVFVRHRIYIVFIHHNYGGTESLELLKMIVKVERNY